MRTLVTDRNEAPWAVAADLMQPPICVRPEDELRRATNCLVANGLRQLPVIDSSDLVIGFLDERDVARIYLRAQQGAADDDTNPVRREGELPAKPSSSKP